MGHFHKSIIDRLFVFTMGVVFGLDLPDTYKGASYYIAVIGTAVYLLLVVLPWVCEIWRGPLDEYGRPIR